MTMLEQELIDALTLAYKHISDSVNMTSGCFDTQPEPASQADYEADQLACYLHNIISKAKGERRS